MAEGSPLATLADSCDERLAIEVPPAIVAWLEGGIVTANVGFDLAFERRQLVRAEREGRSLLSIRVAGDEVLIGPRWVPGGLGACAGCAEARLRLAVDHPLLTRNDVNASARSGWPAVLSVLIEVGLDHLVDHPLAPGEMLSVGLGRTRRHRVVRSIACPICSSSANQLSGPVQLAAAFGPPAPLAWRSRPSTDAVPLRGPTNPAITEPALRRLVDHRVGPVLQVRRDNRAPFAMSSAIVPAARSHGYGRSRSFDQAGRVAVLEAYERFGAFPHHGQILQGLAYDEVRAMAVDPATLGQYTRAQLDHPNGRMLEYAPDVAMDWAFGYRLDDGQARLVPADVAFYGYNYRYRLDYHGARRDRHQPRRVHFFAESSSGCALGSSLEEAALHGLLELAERDSFLLAWCRRTPLPTISQRSIVDDTSRMLLEGIEARGFDVHLLSTTYDLGLPAIWALAVNRSSGAVPATYSAAGSSPQPADAVRAALWELAQLVAHPVDWDVDATEVLVDDPSLVDSIDDHVHLYARPEMRRRVDEVLGGGVVTLDDAFPGWPDELCRFAQGDVRGALEYVLERCHAAGLDGAVVVDQSTTEHTDLGLCVARVVVPGMLPMCFGSPQQRLGGLPRRERALAAVGRGRATDTDLLLDPHPFP